jgi:glycosyltransferase involved in cell wall biosynthesis
MNRRKKIVFFLATLGSGGAERVTINIMRALHPKEFDISLLLVNLENPKYFDLLPNYVNIVNLNMKKTLFTLPKVYQFLKETRADIVYSTLYRTSIILDLSIRLLRKKPFMVLRNPNSPKLVITAKNLGGITRYLLEKAYSKADLVLAQTPEMKEEISMCHQIDTSKIKVLINPVDKENIDKKTTNITNPFDSNRINIVTAGRLNYDKGYDVLIRAFEYVVKENKKFSLHIIGNDNQEEKNLKALVKELNLQKYIYFWDFQSNPYRFFFFSDLYVLSSRIEGLPNTVLENIYLQKPIVATNCIDYMYTLINEGENGFIVNIEDIKGLSLAILKYRLLDGTKSNRVVNLDINQIFSSLED